MRQTWDHNKNQIMRTILGKQQMQKNERRLSEMPMGAYRIIYAHHIKSYLKSCCVCAVKRDQLPIWDACSRS